MKYLRIILLVAFAVLVLIPSVLSFAGDTTSVAAPPISSTWSSILGWIAFALSEILSFLPTQYAGVVKLILTIIMKIIGKGSSSAQ